MIRELPNSAYSTLKITLYPPKAQCLRGFLNAFYDYNIASLMSLKASLGKNGCNLIVCPILRFSRNLKFLKILL